jgi:hypothetical protein
VSPWERRERGGLYYTRSRKVDGRVVREYVGGGIIGTLAARMDAEERQRRQEAATAWREEQKTLEALDAPVEKLYWAAELLSRAVFVAVGYRQHNRGEWRMRRETEDSGNEG